MMSAIILLLAVCATTQATASNAAKLNEKVVVPSEFHTSSSFLRTRRQGNNEDATKCSIILGKATCSSSYTQNVINSISKCGDRATSDINSLEYFCRKNSEGQYCAEVLSSGYVYGNCSSSSTCSAGCSKALMDGGCCYNDGSGSSYNNRYFTACSLPLPSPCAKSRLRVPTITQDSSCSSDLDYQQTLFIAHCDNSQALIRALEKEDICKNDSDSIRDSCASRNGQYCAIELNTTSSQGDSAGIRSLTTAANNCPSTTNCSSQCNSSLSTARNTVGCCFQYINNTNNYYPNFRTTILNSSLWNTCGIPLVSKCGAASTYALYIFIIFLVVSISLLLQN